MKIKLIFFFALLNISLVAQDTKFYNYNKNYYLDTLLYKTEMSFYNYKINDTIIEAKYEKWKSSNEFNLDTTDYKTMLQYFYRTDSLKYSYILNEKKDSISLHIHKSNSPEKYKLNKFDINTIENRKFHFDNIAKNKIDIKNLYCYTIEPKRGCFSMYSYYVTYIIDITTLMPYLIISSKFFTKYTLDTKLRTEIYLVKKSEQVDIHFSNENLTLYKNYESEWTNFQKKHFEISFNKINLNKDYAKCVLDYYSTKINYYDFWENENMLGRLNGNCKDLKE